MRRYDKQAEDQIRYIAEKGTITGRIERLEYLVAQLSQQLASAVVRLNQLDRGVVDEYDEDTWG